MGKNDKQLQHCLLWRYWGPGLQKWGWSLFLSRLLAWRSQQNSLQLPTMVPHPEKINPQHRKGECFQTCGYVPYTFVLCRIVWGWKGTISNQQFSWVVPVVQKSWFTNKNVLVLLEFYSILHPAPLRSIPWRNERTKMTRSKRCAWKKWAHKPWWLWTLFVWIFWILRVTWTAWFGSGGLKLLKLPQVEEAWAETEPVPATPPKKKGRRRTVWGRLLVGKVVAKMWCLGILSHTFVKLIDPKIVWLLLVFDSHRLKTLTRIE